MIHKGDIVVLIDDTTPAPEYAVINVEIAPGSHAVRRVQITPVDRIIPSPEWIDADKVSVVRHAAVDLEDWPEAGV